MFLIKKIDFTLFNINKKIKTINIISSRSKKFS